MINESGWGGLRIASTAALKWWPLWVILAIVVPPLAVVLLFGTVLSPPAQGISIRSSTRTWAAARCLPSSFKRGPPFTV